MRDYSKHAVGICTLIFLGFFYIYISWTGAKNNKPLTISELQKEELQLEVQARKLEEQLNSLNGPTINPQYDFPKVRPPQLGDVYLYDGQKWEYVNLNQDVEKKEKK